jgi:hypothetical protein
MENNNENKEINYFSLITETKTREITEIVNNVDNKDDLSDIFLGMRNLMNAYNDAYSKKLSQLELQDSMELDKLRKIKELLDK